MLDGEGKKIDDIDTDQIFHNSHLHITDIDEMGRFAFGNLSGWENFPEEARKGDLLVVGENFGSGSSRQQAVDCFASLGISLIIGESFGSIYRRNAINSGLAILTCPGICGQDPRGKPWVESGDELEADFYSGHILNTSKGTEIPRCEVPSGVQLEIYKAGGLFNYGRKVYSRHSSLP